YVWHNFAPLLVNPTKIVLTGTGSTQALINPNNYITVDNVRGLEGYAISAPDSSYVEQTINGFFTNASTLDYGGTATGHRRSPNLSGSTSGSSSRWTFRVDSTAPYLIYHYVQSSQNAGGGFYVHLRKFGVGGIVDSIRYEMRSNYSNYAGGSWFPLMFHEIGGVGPNAASITIGADNLSTTFLRNDAVRFLRSTQKADLEFGRRTIDFSPIRVPEEFGQITLGDEIVRNYRLYNLGRDTLVISDIKVLPTLTPVPWFYTKNFSTGNTVKVPPLTVGPDGKEKNGYFDLQLAFSPYTEGSARDSIVIVTNDDNEPRAYNILYGDGLNYNFIMNASAGNTEPHFRAPAPPDVPKLPTYRETANGSWANSGRSPYDFPIYNGNLSSRVNVGSITTSIPHQAYYEFQLPEIAFGKIPTDGRYILEYGGPLGSPNGYTNTLVKVTHTFGVPVDSAYYSGNTVGEANNWRQIGGTAKTFFLAPGGPITMEFAVNAQTNAAGGTGLLRVDLLRVRKVPTGALIGVSVAQSASLAFGDVSFRNPAGVDGKANKKEITIASRGESQVIVKGIRFRVGRYFRLVGTPPTPASPIYLRALTGEQKLSITFVPDRIAPGYVDTLEVLSNSIRDSVLLVRVDGNGIGGVYYIDDDGTTQEVSSTPAFGGLYLDRWDNTKMTNWQVQTSNVPDSIGRGKTRRLLPIYFNPKATFEWYPAIPLDPASGDSVLMNVALTIPRGYAKSSPGARYKVFSTGGNITKDTVVNQNTSVNTTGSSLIEINLGNHYFLRGGRDIAGGQAFFGHVQLFNDTAAVSAYYGTTTNFARRDTFALLADALVLRELDRLQPSITAVKTEVPLEFALSQNYPNPFNPTTTIEFSLARQVEVDLKIYDILGREVATLLQSNAMNAGRYIVRWDGRNRFGQSVATGVYFYRLVAGDFVQSKKMILIK
ncbi:T9SS C-terminal target domain-containing protein, partial [bacterium]